MRQTKILKAVQEILNDVKKPVTVPQIQEYLKNYDLEPNKTTLYRMLDRMVQEGMLNNVLLDSKTAYYELITHHHHHFKCTDCTSVKCIEDSALETQIHALEKTLKAKGFSVDMHHFSFTGKCSECK